MSNNSSDEQSEDGELRQSPDIRQKHEIGEYRLVLTLITFHFM